MIAFKGFTKELVSRLGDGKKENCHFRVGETKKVEKSKTVSCGFHCCENPFECLTYYNLDGKNRFFMVEAAGDIDEDASNRIACTEITLLKELTVMEFAMEGMKYIISHPDRRDWQQSHGTVNVGLSKATAPMENCIAIARGQNPMVKGPKGSILGLIVEDVSGDIIDCKLFRQTEELADKWCTINRNRRVVEV